MAGQEAHGFPPFRSMVVARRPVFTGPPHAADLRQRVSGSGRPTVWTSFRRPHGAASSPHTGGRRHHHGSARPHQLPGRTCAGSPRTQADDLAAEIRTFLVEQVSRTGGHLGPNLGVVELTIAMHRVFESPLDTMVFDTGPPGLRAQAPHGPPRLLAAAQPGGLSGYPSRAESEHDVVENSHASTALSWADGIAKANELQGRGDRHVVAVIGDGALTGGMAWEALNNIAAGQDRRLVIVVNDNGRSYAPTIGGLAHHLDTLRTTRGYENVLSWGKRTLRRVRRARSRHLRRAARHEEGHQGRPGAAGHVRGPRHQVRRPGRRARRARGRARAAQREGVRRAGHRARHHREGPRLRARPSRTSPTGSTRSARSTPRPGCPLAPSRFGWTSVFADEIVRIGRRRPDVVAITAAMLQPVGLAPFAAEFPDAGVRRRHRRAARRDVRGRAWPSAGCTPSSRSTRRSSTAPSTRCSWTSRCTRPASRSCSTAPGSPATTARATTACGTWRCSASCPGLRLAAPRDEATLRDALRAAVDVDDAPTVVRYPKGALVDPIPAIDDLDGVDVLARHDGPADAPHVLVVGVRRDGADRARRRRAARRARPARDRRRPALGPAGARGAHQARRGARPRGHHRGRRRRRRHRRRWSAQRAREAGHRRRPCRRSASRARSSTTRPATSWSTRLRLRPGGHRPGHARRARSPSVTHARRP